MIASAPNLNAENIAFNEGRATHHHHRPRLHDGHYLRAGTIPRRGPAHRAHDQPITYLSDDVMNEVRPPAQTAGQRDRGWRPRQRRAPGLPVQRRRSSSRSRATCATRATSSAVLRCQHLSADHARARLLRSGAALRRRSPERAGARRASFLLVSFTTDWRFSPARSRRSSRPARQPARRQLPRSTRRMARRLPARRSRATWRPCGLFRADHRHRPQGVAA